ncbi:PaaI family thioesterase [Chromatocurvus halotolerans]|uniref:Uncharacterized protein (TIGR00369 family) n=1 Tax=Chromatocurvus halotolerans TaxID=1132028 RepID=A0A4R2KPZ4_9GAMM|nr:PaaI family thioesterase [Chromatocurvus halotolerans]TCO75664.1 uncharacterized protein (TIGR00369 family) [Chromatocurvus halotolerans]
MSPDSVPEGFELMPEGLAYSDSLQPYYRCVGANRELMFGLRVLDQHCNLMGICHGGALMTLADIAAASTVSSQLEAPRGLPTVSLSFDFIAPGRKGSWLQTHTDHVETKRRFGFCSGVIRDGDKVIARYSGTFYIPDHQGVWKDDAGRAAAAKIFSV